MFVGLGCPGPIKHGVGHWLAGVDGMEMEMEDPVALWMSKDAWDTIPGEIIDCPLIGDDLQQYYSAYRAADETGVSMELWGQQQAAQHADMACPSLTKKRGANGRAVMTPKSPSYIADRQKCQSEFVGFAVKWQSQQPTLELVMQPQLASKFFGFLIAKGEAAGRPAAGTRETIRKLATHLKETVEFVLSGSCPGEWQFDQQVADSCMAWYANVRGWVAATNMHARHNSAMPNITYHQAICYAKSSWEEAVTAFQVRFDRGEAVAGSVWQWLGVCGSGRGVCGGGRGVAVVVLQVWLPPGVWLNVVPPLWCALFRRTTVCGPRSWPRECQQLG